MSASSSEPLLRKGRLGPALTGGTGGWSTTEDAKKHTMKTQKPKYKRIAYVYFLKYSVQMHYEILIYLLSI